LKLAALIFSNWETEAILNLSISLLNDPSDRLSVFFVGEAEEFKDSVASLKSIAEEKQLLARSLEAEEKSEESAEAAQIVFSYAKPVFEEVFEVLRKPAFNLVVAGKHDSGKASPEQRVIVRELFEKLPIRTLALRLKRLSIY